MKTELRITSVRVIARATKPVVVFEVENHQPILRTLKQVMGDLETSGRIDANTTEFDELVALEVRACRGAVLVGDIKPFKKGEKYTVTEDSAVLKNPSHPQYGKVKLGQQAVHLEDGVWVEGFLDIPLSRTELRERIKELKEIKHMKAQSIVDDFSFSVPEGDSVFSEALGG